MVCFSGAVSKSSLEAERFSIFSLPGHRSPLRDIKVGAQQESEGEPACSANGSTAENPRNHSRVCGSVPAALGWHHPQWDGPFHVNHQPRPPQDSLIWKGNSTGKVPSSQMTLFYVRWTMETKQDIQTPFGWHRVFQLDMSR